MTKVYSNDLRERVIKSYESGVSKKNISIFMIGTGTMNRWIRKYGGGYLTSDELLYGEDAEIITHRCRSCDSVNIVKNGLTLRGSGSIGAKTATNVRCCIFARAGAKRERRKYSVRIMNDPA